MPPESLIDRLLLPTPLREGWRRNQVAVNIAAGLVFFGFTLVMPFLPLYVAELGVQGVGRIAFWSGLLLSAPPLLAACLGPLWGRVGDRYGMKLMVGRVLVTMIVIWALMALARNVYQVLALRIVLGIFSGFNAMSAALVTQSCPREKIGQAIGTLQATQILSTAIGPLVGGILFALVGIRNAFLVTSGCCAVALVLILILYRDVPHPGPSGRAPTWSGWFPRIGAGWRSIQALPGFVPLLPYLFFANLVDRSFPTVIPLVIQSMIGDAPRRVAAVSGLIVTAHAAAAALSAYALGRFAAHRKPAGILSAILLGVAAVTAGMIFCRTPGQFLALRVAAGLVGGGAMTLGYSAGGAIIPAERRATLYGLLSSAAMLGGAFGPMASGVLAAANLRAPFAAAVLTYLALVPWVLGRLAVLPSLEHPPRPPQELPPRPVNQA